MTTDKKLRVKQPRKRSFHGNRYTKRVRSETEDVCSDGTSVFGINGSECGVSVDVAVESATPTRSEQKISNIYDIMKESSDEESDSSDSEIEDESGELAQDMTSNRIIDIELLNQNIMSQVVCAFCQGYTQNANESINNLIWKFSPKTKNHGVSTVNSAVAIAVSIFNDGTSSVGQMLRNMDLEAGVFACDFFKHKDTYGYRVITAQKQAKQASKESRKQRRLQRTGAAEEMAEKEGFPYVPSGH